MNNDIKSLRIPVNDEILVTEVRSGDASRFVEFLNDREIYDQTLRIPYPYTAADAVWFLEHVRESTARHGHPINFAIRDAEQQLIGGCGFEGLSYGHRAELGYWLAKPFWGQGIMTRVVETMCDYAHDQWQLLRITAHVFEFNVASARVLEKCSFVCEGLLRKHHCKDGKFIDSKLYARVW